MGRLGPGLDRRCPRRAGIRPISSRLLVSGCRVQNGPGEEVGEGPLLARCRTAGAARLRARRRSQQNTAPARAVAATARMIASPRRRVPWVAVATTGLKPETPRAGSRCHRPNSPLEKATATGGDQRRSARPSSAPRNSVSSSTTVPSGIRTRVWYSNSVTECWSTRRSANRSLVAGRAAPTASTSAKSAPTAAPRRKPWPSCSRSRPRSLALHPPTRTATSTASTASNSAAGI